MKAERVGKAVQRPARTSEHTPGPWRAVRWVVDCWLVQSGERPEAVMNLAKADKEANARLMAAAPDLLDALASARNDLRRYAPPNAPSLKAVRAAIAKATGDDK